MTLFAFALKSGQDVAQRGRIALSSFLVPRLGALTSYDGLVDDGGGVVTAVPGTMNVSITPFRGFVQGAQTAQGVYPVASLSNLQVTLPNGGATDKTYQIVAQVQDSSMDSSGVQSADCTYIDPAAPPSWSYIPIWNVRVPAGRTAGSGGMLTSYISSDARRFVASNGGFIPVATSAGRVAVSEDGHFVYQKDAAQPFVRRAGNMHRMPFVQGGEVTITPTTINTTFDKKITFPTPFLKAPVSVVVSIETGIGSGLENQVWCSSTSWTPTDFVVSYRRGNLTPTTIAWMALEA